jgi:hypothetical protein
VELLHRVHVQVQTLELLVSALAIRLQARRLLMVKVDTPTTQQPQLLAWQQFLQIPVLVETLPTPVAHRMAVAPQVQMVFL